MDGHWIGFKVQRVGLLLEVMKDQFFDSEAFLVLECTLAEPGQKQILLFHVRDGLIPHMLKHFLHISKVVRHYAPIFRKRDNDVAPEQVSQVFATMQSEDRRQT